MAYTGESESCIQTRPSWEEYAAAHNLDPNDWEERYFYYDSFGGYYA